jgi:hypothetical protein
VDTAGVGPAAIRPAFIAVITMERLWRYEPAVWYASFAIWYLRSAL